MKFTSARKRGDLLCWGGDGLGAGGAPGLAHERSGTRWHGGCWRRELLVLAGDEPAGGWSWWDPTALPQLWAGGLDARGWHDAGVMAQCRGNGTLHGARSSR